MKKKYTYSIAPEVSLQFEVMAENDDEAIKMGENRFHVWLEKATKAKLADAITHGLNAIEAQVWENGITRNGTR